MLKALELLGGSDFFVNELRFLLTAATLQMLLRFR